MMEEQKIRNDQQVHGRRLEAGVGSRPKVAKAGPSPKGHEAFLKALESSGAVVCFVMASSGEKITGKVKTSDKFTISVAVPVATGSEQHTTRVLFKHDISEFSTLGREAR